ncbi:MAG: hypothetical protein HDT25_09585, partial [Ruminococcus sp.]|nr:hypothetical protein [Ruminococcus sp.]
MKAKFTAAVILAAMVLLSACRREANNEITETIMTEETAVTAEETSADTTAVTEKQTAEKTTVTTTETVPTEIGNDVKAARFLGSDECLGLEWEFGTFIDINDKPPKEIILWHGDDLGNLMGTVFDVSGDAPENIGTFAADISDDGSFLIPASRLYQTTELYFTPLIKTENGCRLMRY